MEQNNNDERLKEKYYKRYGIAYTGLLKTKKTFKSLTMSLGEIFLLLKKRKKNETKDERRWTQIKVRIEN